MLVINVKVGYPIEVEDTDSGTKWKMSFYWTSSGQPSLAIDAPKSVKFNYDMKSKRKGNQNEPG